MQEGKPEDPEKTCGSKYGLETKCTYGAGTGNRTRAHWCIAPGKNRYATCFNSHMSCSHVTRSFVYYWYHCQVVGKGEGLGRMEEKTHCHNPHLQHKQPELKWIWAADGDVWPHWLTHNDGSLITCSFNDLSIMFADNQSALCWQGTDWSVWDRFMVFLTVPRRIRQTTQAVDLWILSQIYEIWEDIQEAFGK